MPLTARQPQCSCCSQTALRADDIAGEFGIATSAVYKHAKHARDRAGAEHRRRHTDELVELAIPDGILLPGQ